MSEHRVNPKTAIDMLPNPVLEKKLINWRVIENWSRHGCGSYDVAQEMKKLVVAINEFIVASHKVKVEFIIIHRNDKMVYVSDLLTFTSLRPAVHVGIANHGYNGCFIGVLNDGELVGILDPASHEAVKYINVNAVARTIGLTK